MGPTTRGQLSCGSDCAGALSCPGQGTVTTKGTGTLGSAAASLLSTCPPIPCRSAEG